MEHMTALVSCFARAYHFRNSEGWVFRDEGAEKLLTEAEYQSISQHMSAGISFFEPDFHGDGEAALHRVVNHYLAPPVLGRSTFCERALAGAVRAGCAQYVLFGSGYDSFSIRCPFPELKVYELDRQETIQDKQDRLAARQVRPRCPTAWVPCDLTGEGWEKGLKEAGFRPEGLAFGGLLGLSYYLPREDFQRLLERISRLFAAGSSIVLDYPAPEEGGACAKNRALAKGAGEEMRARYSRDEMEQMLDGCGFLVYEHLDDREMTDAYFSAYNSLHPDDPMRAPVGTRYCLAVKK